ncbi:hypothetical protein K7X08_011252 [Anisodus acutangulus]|uniref:Uncharacterized protein n=1 Tax=Anisodus acutangulus TaxID=402998 RepID=A0A9Q1LYT6_9SOLA|nr:hypothetical protein K7X08_011252 [Anisodus acutangulus]
MPTAAACPVDELECGLVKSSPDGLICSEDPLQLHISASVMDTFMKLAKSNTNKNLETCGVLAGSLVCPINSYLETCSIYDKCFTGYPGTYPEPQGSSRFRVMIAMDSFRVTDLGTDRLLGRVRVV